MEDNLSDRMAAPRKRGRPSNTEIAARSEPEPVEAVHIPVPGIRCMHCGRGTTPRIIRTAGLQRTVACTLCGRHMVLVYKAGVPVLGRVI